LPKSLAKLGLGGARVRPARLDVPSQLRTAGVFHWRRRHR